ncbi:MAG: polysaccharide pyruvyl transferase family protein [Nitrospiria bacterium]
MKTRALLVGHFSTVGDIESLDLVRGWLEEIDVDYDIAPFKASVGKQMRGVVDASEVDPGRYRCLVMICGPVSRDMLEKLEFDLSRFRHCVCIGVNLTMVTPLHIWNPFDVLLERDSDRLTRPDLTFLAQTGTVPVVGRCLVRKQTTYHGRERHDEAAQCFNDLIQRHNFAVLDLDTRWYLEKNSLKSAVHFLSALKRVDLLLTNRLHGMVYALKTGVPVIAIDAIEGGAKVAAQAKAIGWPQCILIQDATPARLDAAIAWCRSPLGREAAQACQKRVLPVLREVKRDFISAFESSRLELREGR